MPERVAIPGSTPSHSSNGSWLGADPNQRLTVTILIRRPPRIEDLSQKILSGTLPQMSRAEGENFLHVDPADLQAVLAFVKSYGLTVVAENDAARSVQVEGSIKQLEAAFGVEIGERINAEGQKYLSYEGSLTVPADLAGIVEAVLGLDQRPIAHRGAAH